MQDCHRNILREDIGRVWVEEVSYSNNFLTQFCRPEVVRLNPSGQGYIYCFCDGPQCVTQGETYETVLKVVLTYGYRDSIHTMMRVIDNPSLSR